MKLIAYPATKNPCYQTGRTIEPKGIMIHSIGVPQPDPKVIAENLQKAIFERTGLTASAGVSYNKFLAKSASDYRKPAGLTLITPETAPDFLDALPIDKFFGIGKVGVKKLHTINVRCGKDLKKLSDPAHSNLARCLQLFSPIYFFICHLWSPETFAYTILSYFFEYFMNFRR
jgi:nucleotidyltransferase/DNA polymerase involved in DNA repair